MTTSVKLYTFDYSNVKTYLFAILFTIGNILLPQLCHLAPQGGITWLPIYFFTLIAAYNYGWKVGLLTAILSPVVNNLLFAMPATAMLPVILTKSILLVAAAWLVAKYFKGFSLLAIAAVVIGYQAVGTLAEWAMTGSLYTALQDIRIGFPGIILQIFGGYLFIKFIAKH